MSLANIKQPDNSNRQSCLARNLPLFFGVCLSVIIGCGLLALQLLPAGVPGEWVWQKPRTTATAREWLWGFLTILGYLSIQRALAWLSDQTKGEILAVFLLFPIAALVQVGLQKAAPDTYGLAKWPLCTYFEGSSGYFTVAENQVQSLAGFLHDYPQWIKMQDCLHIGTHPPGLIVEARLWLDFWVAKPELAKQMIALIPGEFRDAMRHAAPGKSLPLYYQLALISISFTHWLICAATVWPLFWLCRRLGFESKNAIAIASIWPVVPSAIMFQPASDIIFGFFTSVAIAFTISTQRIAKKPTYLENFMSGLILAGGMFFSLVFLPIGLIVALVILINDEMKLKFRIFQIIFTGAGFFVGTLLWAMSTSANPVLIWYANQQNHGRFYVEYPRSYGKWLMADVIESSFGLGLPMTFLLIYSAVMLFRSKDKMNLIQLRVFCVTIAVLGGLAISGKSLSEVSRLWLPFFPLLLSGLGPIFQKVDQKNLVSWILLWTMIQVVWLQQLIQVVYAI